MLLFAPFGVFRMVNLSPLTSENLPLIGGTILGNGLGVRSGEGQIVLTSKYMLNITPPKTRNPNNVETKGSTKLVRHEPLGWQEKWWRRKKRVCKKRQGTPNVPMPKTRAHHKYKY